VSVALPLFAMILKFGSTFSIVRLFPGKDIEEMGEDLSSLLLLVTLALLSFIAVLMIFPTPLADTIFDGHVMIVQMVALLVVSYCLSGLFSAVFRAFREMKKLETINIIQSTAKILVIGLVVFLGYGLIAILLAVFIVWGFFTCVLFYLVLKKIPLKRPKISSLKEYISLGLPTVPAGISQVVVIISDRYVIGFFLGATVVGYYSPAYIWGETLPKFVTGVLSIVLLPTLSEYYEKGDVSKVRDLLDLSTKYFLSFSVPLVVIFTIVGRDLLTLLTTAEIAANGYEILVLTSIVGILMGLEAIFAQGVYLKKRTKLIGFFWIAAAIFNVTGNIILVPRIGMIAAAMTSIVSYLIVATFTLFFTRKKLSFSTDHMVIAKIILSCLLMGLLLFIIRAFIWDDLTFSIVIGLGTYILFLYLLGVIGDKEIELVNYI